MEIKKIIIISVISGTAFTLGLLLVIIGLVFSYRKKRILQNKEFEMELKNKELEMMNAVVQAQESERTKIARNLHDEVGSILSMAQQNLSAVIQQIPNNSPFREDVEFTMDVLEQSVAKIRSISHGMLPHFLVKFGLKKSLQRLIDQTQKTLGNPCSFFTSIEDDLVLDKEAEIHFYSISLELLNNLLKHARPQSVNLFLELRSNHLYLKMRHDGVAISQADYEYLLHHGDGMGLESVSHRLKLIAGEIQFQRNALGGTIELAMPLSESIKLTTHEEIQIP
jgi:signal transduction histidine kinase